MLPIGEGLFVSLAKLDKLYRKMCSHATEEYKLTPNEITVLMFLTNNAPLDTATDIARCKGIAKSLVAHAVDSLTARGYLVARRDSEDRRIVRLTLTPESEPVTRYLKESRHALTARLVAGIPPEHLALLDTLSMQMEDNLNRMLREDEIK